jgi:hypothetical protein
VRRHPWPIALSVLAAEGDAWMMAKPLIAAVRDVRLEIIGE